MDENNVRKDSVSREVLRHPEFVDSVELSRVRDYFLCMSFFVLLYLSPSCVNLSPPLVNVESEGAYTPERLLPEALKVMREKISIIKNATQALKAQIEGTGSGDVDMVDT